MQSSQFFLQFFSYPSAQRQSEEEPGDADDPNDNGLLAPQLGLEVEHAAEDRLGDGELRVEAEGEEHGEEEDGPEGRPGEAGHQVGVRDEGQAGAALDHVLDLK